MPAYVFFERVELWDRGFSAEYRKLAAGSIAKYGGRYLGVSYRNILLEGNSVPDMVCLYEFPAVEDAKRWYFSDEYQCALRVRNKGSRDRAILFEGAIPPYVKDAGNEADGA